MKQYLSHHPWKIIEDGFHPEYNRISESIFSLGNGMMGLRGNSEESFSGNTLQGSYLAGIYYPDKTRVGWWKNGYPEYFAKVLNAPNWIGIDIRIDDEVLDLAQVDLQHFRRELDMKAGTYSRSFEASFPSGKTIRVNTIRFCSLNHPHCGAIRYSITPLNFNGRIHLHPYVDGDIVNQDSNYDEKFWIQKEEQVNEDGGFITVETKKTAFLVRTGFTFELDKNGSHFPTTWAPAIREKYAGIHVHYDVVEGDTLTLKKYAANISSFHFPKNALHATCTRQLRQLREAGFDQLLASHTAAWQKKWDQSDIVIEGDVAAQQGIRFNIFQLNQTYTGEDPRLNIGPKGFTGEKYGGSTYWDTEAYCLPYYLSTAAPQVARNLLVYRYKHLDKAIENAEKLGFSKGAALYPMVTMNGEECHNEWEITFEEIHRNGAIAFAIFDYIRQTGDEAYLATHGLEVLLGIARFWAQRIHFSVAKQKYVMLGVTGPNEYENNVNNNWYTNYIACWCLHYTTAAINQVKSTEQAAWNRIAEKTQFSPAEEKHWQEIIEQMYYPFDEERNIFLQQEGFLDKEIKPATEIPEGQYPIHQHWSWDRILRSCYIKQADVLQGLYLFEDQFDKETIKRNFDFYEPLTVHESSLSPCVHSILACSIGYYDKAYEMYLRTARLDLDDYNNDTEDGCHITSMAGTWMAIVKGFAGMRIKDQVLFLHPYLPEQWTSYAFEIQFGGAQLKVKVLKDGCQIENESEIKAKLHVYDELREVDALKTITIYR